MSWLNCLRFSMLSCFSPPNLDVAVFWSWNLNVVAFWSWDLNVVVVVSPRPRFGFHSENRKITQNILNCVK